MFENSYRYKTSLRYSFSLDCTEDMLSSQLSYLNSPRSAELLVISCFYGADVNYKHKPASTVTSQSRRCYWKVKSLPGLCTKELWDINVVWQRKKKFCAELRYTRWSISHRSTDKREDILYYVTISLEIICYGLSNISYFKCLF